MKDDVAGSIVKADGQKEDGAAPTVALWDSWFYRGGKADKGMVHPLSENWKYLLCIFRKFSLRWWKRRQLSSWINFYRRYQISSHINHRSWIMCKYFININPGGGVSTQKEYIWSNMGSDCYIQWYSQRILSITILRNWYLPMNYCMARIEFFSWWEWDADFFWSGLNYIIHGTRKVSLIMR